jgi:hypothetical protein
MLLILSVIYAECHKYAHYAQCHYAECRYAECHYAECRYAECHYAECRGATKGVDTNVPLFQKKMKTFLAG